MQYHLLELHMIGDENSDIPGRDRPSRCEPHVRVRRWLGNGVWGVSGTSGGYHTIPGPKRLPCISNCNQWETKKVILRDDSAHKVLKSPRATCVSRRWRGEGGQDRGGLSYCGPAVV